MTGGRVETPKRVGFIGVGNQGGPMAMRMIEAGWPVSVWARRPEALEPYVAAGASAAVSPRALGEASDFVGICVVNDADTIEVCEPLVAGMAPGAILAIHSTVHPDTCRRLAALAAQRSVRVFDAPVSGSAIAAREGRLTVMTGGDADVISACEPIMKAYAGVVARLGDLGAGQLAKLVNNALMAANMMLAHDAIGLGRDLGLDAAALAAVIKASSGGSFAMNAYAGLPSPGAFVRGGLLLRKDVGILSEVEAAAGAPASTLLPMATAFLDLVDADAPPPAL